MRAYFAYMADGEVFDSDIHAREDERVLDLSFDQSEDEFGSAVVEVEAKSDGYLRLGRRVAISVEHASQIHPILIGTITGAPLGITGETVRVEISGKLPGWQTAQIALLDSLKTAPHYDQLAVPVDQRNDKGAVLTGWGGTIAWDRVTGAPRFSDLIDGPVTHDMPRFFRDSVSLDVEEPPVSTIALKVRAGWRDDASVRLPVVWSHGSSLEVVADKALQEAFPRPGDTLGGGWEVESARLKIGRRRLVQIGKVSGQFASEIYSGDVPFYRVDESGVDLLHPRSQAREEEWTLRIGADVQPLSEAVEEERVLEFGDLIGAGDEIDPWSPTSSYQIGDRVFYAREIYEAVQDHTAGMSFDMSKWNELEDVQGSIYRTFFQTFRGHAALDYAVEVARARLKYAARSVRVAFEVPLEDALGVQIDHRAALSDPRLPGGSAVGKVVSYGFSFGANGSRTARIEIAAAVGRGGEQDVTAPNLVSLTVPTLGPSAFSATGSISPTAQEELAALRERPDAFDASIRVQIDATAVPVAPLLRDVRDFDLGTISLERGIDLE